MPPEIDTTRIRYLLGINRRDILAVDYYFERKLAAYFGLLYRTLERGTPDERYYAYVLRRLPATADRVESIRWKYPELTGDARFYAAAILAEWDTRREIGTLELRVEEELAPEDLLDRAIELKEREEEFLYDLHTVLRTRVPERPEWADYVLHVRDLVLERLEELREMRAVWEYTLRISARVVRMHAPGSTKPYKPPRWVTVTGASPIFVELSFERFISSLDEEELELAYKDEFIKLVEGYKADIARYNNVIEVELAEWDFGIEGKESSKYREKKSRDFWEIYVYLPSGYSYLIADDYYEHDV